MKPPASSGLALAGAALALVLLLGACGGDDDEIRPVADAPSVILSAVELHPAGQAADFPNGMRVIVQGTKDIERPERTEPLHWVEVSLRIENSSDEAVARPDISVTCADGSGGTYYVTSAPGNGALEKLTELPAKSSAEGVMLFGMPKPCDDARVKVSAMGALVGAVPAPAYWRMP